MESSSASRVAAVFDDAAAVIAATREALVAEIEAAGRMLADAVGDGRTVYLLGNGGSAADCQHLAAELVGRFEADGRPLAAIALTTDTSVLTALANDFGFERVFERQVEALVRAGDVVVALSTSGSSPNVVSAVRAARRLGARTIALTGRDGGAVGDEAELVLRVPSTRTARIQEAHIVVGHALCELVESRLRPQDG